MNRTSNRDNTIKGNFCEVAPEWAGDLHRSMEWLSHWYSQRTNYKLGEGLGIVGKVDVYNVKAKLSKTWVCANKGGAACIRQALQQGELSTLASEEELADYGLSPDGQVVDESQFNKLFVLSDEVAGRFIPIFDVPVVIINTDLIHQKQAEGLPIYAGDTLIHELTHGLERTADERIAEKMINQKDAYLDAGDEVYARLNEVRAHYQLDPTKAVTLDDIQSMRQRMQVEKQAFLNKRSELDRDKAHMKGALVPELFNALPKILVVDKVLSRYSDEELLKLFNETAMLPTRDMLDEEHALALDQEPERGLDRQMQLEATQREGMTQGLRATQNVSPRRC